MNYTEIDKCRICNNFNLTSIIHLGNQYLGGIFPEEKEHLKTLASGPLELVKCRDDLLDDACGLLQLRQSYDPDVMFTNNKYGYLSSLNKTMIDHLQNKVRRIADTVQLNKGDCIVDIGSNDATLLKAYPKIGLDLIGVDPSADRLRQYYYNDIRLIADFFSAAAFRDHIGRRKAKVVTSIAMFYDLESPMQFMREVYDILADDGIWVTEQGYMPLMLFNLAYDAVCHEHLEYYSLKQIKWMADRVGFRVIDVEHNDINGGSFSVTLAKGGTSVSEAELEPGLPLDSYSLFADAVEQSKQDLRDFLGYVKTTGKLICGLGASTKGNTLLQYCGITEEDIPFIGEVNSDKFGCFTPGTQIPIIPEQEMLAMKPDYCLVLPWHFRDFFEQNPRYAGTKLVFPLPTLMVSNNKSE